MPDRYQLWEWASALKASLPFAMALPIFIATVFASLVDWVEAYLVGQQYEQDRSDDGTAVGWAGHEREMTERLGHGFRAQPQHQKSA